MPYTSKRRVSRTKTTFRPMTSAGIFQDQSHTAGELQREQKTINDRCKSAPDKYRLSRSSSKLRSRSPPKIVRKAAWSEKSTPSASPGGSRGSISLGYDPFQEDYDFDKWSDDDTLDFSQENKKLYEVSCKKLGVIPIHSFSRQMTLNDTDIALKNKLLTSDDVKAVAISLVNNDVVESLNLSGNNIGPIGIKYISEMMVENSHVTKLDLSSTNPGLEGLSYLTQVFQNSRTLRELNLSGNNFDIGHSYCLAKLISTNDYLQRLDLSYNKLGDDGGQILGPAIEENVALHELNLKWNHLRMRGAIAVAKGIEANSRLEKVDLSWNGFGLEGCVAMATTLASSQSLRELDMTCNRIDINALEKLLEGVVLNDTLQILRLGLNPMTTDGAMLLLNKLKETPNSAIHELDISEVPVDSQFQDILLELQSSRQLTVKHGKSFRVNDIRLPDVENNFQHYDPLMILYQYMKEDNLRLIDVFHSFDLNRDDTLTRQEFKDGFLSVNIPITENGLDILLKRLDMNSDGKVDFTELGDGHKEIKRKMGTLMHKLRERKMVTGVEEENNQPFSKLQGLVKEAVTTKRAPKAPRKYPSTKQLKGNESKSDADHGEETTPEIYPGEEKQSVENEDDFIELANNLRQLFQSQRSANALKLVFRTTAAISQFSALKC